MHPAIELRTDQKRGCGWRKKGGLYLISEGPGRGCGRLPIILSSCPTCGGGIRQTRGWTWVNGAKLAETEVCTAEACTGCPLADLSGMTKVGLLWVGAAFYETPEAFTAEANAMGISRRISAIPRDFKIGESWCWLAHPRGVKNPEPAPELDPAMADDEEAVAAFEAEKKEYREWLPAVFRIFRPQRIEYVVRGDESDEDIERLVERGITPVLVRKLGETESMFGQPAEDAA